MKKLINDARSVVREMLEGLVDLAPGQALLESEDVVIRAGLPPYEVRREVAILSGGGSGHEPAHAGYVGAGMLHAAVAGDVFTSPSADAVFAALRAVTGAAGCCSSSRIIPATGSILVWRPSSREPKASR